VKKVFFVLPLFLSSVMFSGNSLASDWTFELEPYAFGSTIAGDASVGRATGAEVDVDLDTILENLKMAGMAHFEAHHANGWGVIVDYGFMDLGSDVSGPRGGLLDAEVRQGVFEGFVSKRVEYGADNYVDYFAGVRWWDQDIDVEIVPAILPGTVNFEVEEDWVDPVVGARWTRALNDRWSLSLRGDVGGFGLEADFSATAALGAVYRFNDRFKLDLQYKGLWVDYESGTRGRPGYFEYDTVTHGPILGLIINF
jgi:hypothetical protein